MCTSYKSTSCSNNDGAVCVTDFMPFVRSFRHFLDYILTTVDVMHQNSIDPDDRPRQKYYCIFAIEGRAWVEAKKDV